MEILIFVLLLSFIFVQSFALPAFTPTGTTVLMNSTTKCEDGKWKNTINDTCYNHDDYDVIITNLGLQEGAGHQSTIFGEIQFSENRQTFRIDYSSGIFYYVYLDDYYNFYVYDYISQASHSPSYGREIRGHTIFFAFMYKGTSTDHSLEVHLYDRDTNEWFVDKKLMYSDPITYYTWTKLRVDKWFNYFGVVNRAITMEEMNNVVLGAVPNINGSSLPIKSGLYHFLSVEVLYKELYGVDVCKTSCGTCKDMQFTDNPRFETLGLEKCGNIDTELYNTILSYYILNYTPLDGKPGYNPLLARTRFLATLDIVPTVNLAGHMLIVKYKLKPFTNVLSLGLKTYIKNSNGASMKIPGIIVSYGPEYYEVTSTIEYKALIDLGCQRTNIPSYVCPFFLDFVGLDSYGGYGTLLKTAIFTVEITFNPETESITGGDVEEMVKERLDCNCTVVANADTKLTFCEDFSCTNAEKKSSYKLGDYIYLKQKIEEEDFRLFKLVPFSITFTSSTGSTPMVAQGPFDYENSSIGEVIIKIQLAITGKLTISVLSILTKPDQRLLEGMVEQAPAFKENTKRKAINTKFEVIIDSEDSPSYIELKEDSNMIMIVGLTTGAAVIIAVSLLVYCYCIRRTAAGQKEAPAKSSDKKKVPIESPVRTEEPMKSSARAGVPIECPIHMEVPVKELEVAKPGKVENRIQLHFYKYLVNQGKRQRQLESIQYRVQQEIYQLPLLHRYYPQNRLWGLLVFT
eukprot:TRINITY_DN608_c0_g1_i1.p1 TRINITY_DN608_c0_g1~~TRINITY_DN608_c0_g1_i1.p1  ORF type:complete len:742 (+),score=27.12 TRINITY_DN608_c0_g1_i1:715-2940(+)